MSPALCALVIVAQADSLDTARERFSTRGALEAALVAYESCKAGNRAACVQAAVFFLIDGQGEVIEELIGRAGDVQADFTYELDVLIPRARAGRLAYTKGLRTLAKRFDRSLVGQVLLGLAKKGNLSATHLHGVADLCAAENTRDLGGRIVKILGPRVTHSVDCNAFPEPRKLRFDFFGCSIRPDSDGFATLPAFAWPRGVAVARYEDRPAIEVRINGPGGPTAIDLSGVDWAQPTVIVRKVPAGARARIDGDFVEPKQNDGSMVLSPSAGRHVIEIVHDDRQSFSSEIDAAYLRTHEIEGRMDYRSPAWRPIVGWSALAVGVVGGALVGFAANTASDARSTLAGRVRTDGAYAPGAYQAALDAEGDANRLAVVGVALGAAGTAAMTAVIVHYLFDDQRAPEWRSEEE